MVPICVYALYMISLIFCFLRLLLRVALYYRQLVKEAVNRLLYLLVGLLTHGYVAELVYKCLCPLLGGCRLVTHRYPSLTVTWDSSFLGSGGSSNP